MDVIQKWKEEAVKNKKAKKYNRFLSNVFNTVSVCGFAAAFMSQKVDFLDAFIFWFAMEVIEPFFKRQETSEVEKDLMSKMHIETAENAVVSRYILLKLSALKSGVNYTTQIDAEYRKMVKQINPKFKKFKNNFGDKSYRTFDASEFVRQNIDSIKSELEFFNIASSEFFADVGYKAPVNSVAEKLSALDRDAFTSEQLSQIKDVEKDNERLSSLRARISSLPVSEQVEAQKVIDTISDNCMHIIDAIILKEKTSLDKELNQLQEYTERKKMTASR